MFRFFCLIVPTNIGNIYVCFLLGFIKKFFLHNRERTNTLYVRAVTALLQTGAAVVCGPREELVNTVCVANTFITAITSLTFSH